MEMAISRAEYSESAQGNNPIESSAVEYRIERLMTASPGSRAGRAEVHRAVTRLTRFTRLTEETPA